MGAASTPVMLCERSGRSSGMCASGGQAGEMPAPPGGAGTGVAGGQAGEMPVHLAGVGFLGGACVPSLVLGFRTPNLPLLPVWEKGVGGMRRQTCTGMQRTTHRAQERSP